MNTRVLIVEDNAAHMELAARLLRKLGCTVLHARSAEEGLEIARAELPEVVLMDIRLPGMDGLAATRALKADAATAGIKVIVITSFREEEVPSLPAADADAFMQKPFHYKDLADTLNALLAVSGS